VCQHTVAIKSLLVAFTADDAFLHSLGFLGVLLKGDKPGVTLFAGGGFELLVVVTFLELELSLALLGDLGDFGLGDRSAGRLE
jgi:hypothetical protein